MAALVLTFSAVSIYVMTSRYRDRVVQEIRYNCGTLCGTESNDVCYTTWVYKGNKIVKVWWDNPDTITDSIKNKRIQDGLEYLKSIEPKHESKTTFK